jgi:hypothetical protein
VTCFRMSAQRVQLNPSVWLARLERVVCNYPVSLVYLDHAQHCPHDTESFAFMQTFHFQLHCKLLRRAGSVAPALEFLALGRLALLLIVLTYTHKAYDREQSAADKPSALSSLPIQNASAGAFAKVARGCARTFFATSFQLVDSTVPPLVW